MSMQVFCMLMLLANVPGAVWPLQQASDRAGRGKTSKLQSSKFEELARAATIAREHEQSDQAIQLYRQTLQLRPEWQEGRWYLSTLLYQKELYADCRDHLRRFVAIDPQTGPAWAVLGMSEYQLRDYSRALDHLQRAANLGLGDRKDLARSMFYFTALLLTREERYDDAMNLLISMVKSTSETEFLVEPLGIAALRLPLLPQEIPADRRELVEMAGKATLAVEAQQQQEAVTLFDTIAAKYPNENGVHFLYGAYLMDLRPDDGVLEMKRELEVSPSGIPARLRLAEQYIKDENSGEALRLAREAIELDPENSAARMILGESLIAAGEVQQGIAELEKARQQTPERVRTHWDLLRAYTAAGRLEDARREKGEIEKLNAPVARP